MAYLPKQITLSEYQNSTVDIIENIEYDKIYYMPQITDATVRWSINFFDANDPEGSPIAALNTHLIETKYRVLLTKKIIPGDEQHYLVVDSGFSGGRPWINANMVINGADISFEDLPIGTVIYWTQRTFFSITKYVATLAENYIDTGTNTYAGRFLDYGIRPPILPVGNVKAESLFVSTDQINVCLINFNNETILNQSYNARDYGIIGIIPKNKILVY